MTKENYLETLAQRWREIFSSLRAGRGESPSFQMHTEGMMLAAQMLEFASAETLQTLMADVYEEVYGEPLSLRWGEAWPEMFLFPQIPAFTERAPVYPSTSD